jgi:hypothetical protein
MKFVKLLILMTFAVAVACTSKPASAPASAPALTEKTEPGAAMKQAVDKLANTKTYYYLLTNDVDRSKMEFYFERPDKIWMKGKGNDFESEIYVIGNDNYISHQHGDNEWFKNSPLNDGVDLWITDIAKSLASGKCKDYGYVGRSDLNGKKTFIYSGKCDAQPEPFQRKFWLSEETGLLLKAEDDLTPSAAANGPKPDPKVRTVLLDYDKKMEVKAPISE